MNHRITTIAAAACVSLGLLAACDSMGMGGGNGANDDARPMQAEDEQQGQTVAVANIRTAPAATTQPAQGTPTGTVTFTQQGDQVRIVADIQGLRPNTTHGIHIHETGDLSAPDFTSAGGHYNPDDHPHAGPDADERHAGDLGNLEADAQGRARKELVVDNITINGDENPVVGKPVIIHAQADDLESQPTGDAGGRIGGGIIELQE